MAEILKYNKNRMQHPVFFITHDPYSLLIKR